MARAAAIANPGAVFQYGSPQRMVVAAESAATGRELFVSTDDFATATAIDVVPGASGSSPSDLAPLYTGFYSSSSALLFSASASSGAAPTLHVLEDSTVCRPTLSVPFEDVSQLVLAAGALWGVGTQPGASSRQLFSISAVQFASKSLCSGTIGVTVAPDVIPDSRLAACGSTVFMLGHTSASATVALYGWTGEGAHADPLPLSPQPPSSAGGLLPYPRCSADGSNDGVYVAFATAGGALSVVSVQSTWTQSIVTASNLAYTNARAITPIGYGFIFAATITAGGSTHDGLLVWEHPRPGGLWAANAAVSLPLSLSWMLQLNSMVYTACTTAAGDSAACVYSFATYSWSVASGVTVPYSSFLAQGSTVYFAGSTDGGRPKLLAMPVQ